MSIFGTFLCFSTNEETVLFGYYDRFLRQTMPFRVEVSNHAQIASQTAAIAKEICEEKVIEKGVAIANLSKMFQESSCDLEACLKCMIVYGDEATLMSAKSHANYEVLLHIDTSKQPTVAKLFYNECLFTKETMDIQKSHLISLLNNAVEKWNTDVPLVVSDMVSLEEYQKLYNLSKNVPKPSSTITIDISIIEKLHELVEYRAARNPDSVAVVMDNSELTYGQLVKEAQRVSSALRLRGVVSGSLVGVCMNRSIELVVTLLGVLKCGGAYVPIDPKYPPDRILYIMQDSSAKVIVSNEFTVNNLVKIPADLSDRVVMFESILQAQPSNDNSELPITVDRSSPAYVIYTSGTTGRPKGVLIEHHTVCNFIRSEGKLVKLKSSDRVLQLTSPSFDASVWEFWLTLGSGAQLVMAREDDLLPDETLANLIQQEKISVVSTVPSVLNTLDPTKLPTLHTVVTGGEACTMDLVNKWLKTGKRVFNAYGPTETTVDACVYQFTGTEWKPSIGRPLEHIKGFVLDKDMRLAPFGVPGQLALGGPCLAKGYLGRPEETSKKFIDLSIHDTTLKVYMTGDVVRYRLDGNIEFIGRADSQVKIRGFRIELNEVDSVIEEFNAVMKAITTVKKNSVGSPQLVSYVVINEEGKKMPNVVEQISAFIATKLARYMIPSKIMVLPEIPFTPNGKVNMNALPDPFKSTTKKASDAQAEMTSLEAELLGHWKSILGNEELTIQDNFFQVGGDSILAARFLGIVRRAHLPSFSFKDFLDNPTIKSLSSLIQQHNTEVKVNVNTEAPQEFSLGFWCGLCQFLGIVCLICSVIANILLPYYVAARYIFPRYGLVAAVFGTPALLIISGFFQLMFTALLKWMLIGRYKPGEHVIGSWFFIRWWFIYRLVNVTNFMVVSNMRGTIFQIAWLKMMGATVDWNVYIDTVQIFDFDLIRIGSGCVLESGSLITGHTISNGKLQFKNVSVDNCHIGRRAIVTAPLHLTSIHVKDASIPALHNVTQAAAKQDPSIPDLVMPLKTTLLQLFGFGVIALVAEGCFYPVYLIAYQIAMAVDSASHPEWLGGTTVALIAGAAWFFSYSVIFRLAITVLKWIIIGKIKPCTFKLNSFYFARRWLAQRLIHQASFYFDQFHGTRPYVLYFRAMGATVGQEVEFWSDEDVDFDLLTVEDGGYIASDAIVASEKIEGNKFTLEPVVIEAHAFVGNHAVVEPGSKITRKSLLGAMSLATPGSFTDENQILLGAPAIKIPKQEKPTDANFQTVYKPPFIKKVIRGAFDGGTVWLMITLYGLIGIGLVRYFVFIEEQYGEAIMLATLPAVYLLYFLLTALIIIILKWIAIGEYKECRTPYWAAFFWRRKFSENMAKVFYVFLGGMLRGTPFLVWYYRLLGANIGSNVYLDTIRISEYDLLTIGDNSIIAMDAVLQISVNEDRLFKLTKVTIGNRCTIGHRAVVLPGVVMGDNVQFMPQSLAMKGEVFVSNTVWSGCPAVLNRM